MRFDRLILLLIAVLSIVGIKKAFFHSPLKDQSESLLLNLATPQEAPNPREALRLRVIANSNSASDQTLKLQVRNAIVSKVGQFLTGAKTPAQAKAILTQETPVLQKVAMDVVREHGVKYPVQTEFAKVAFPTKVYGTQVYPAGDYEALRIVLGAGKGENWWCVIYPPLCFIDIAEGDAIPNTRGFPDTPPLETIDVANANGATTKVQVRMLSLDIGEEIWRALKNLG